MGSEFVSTGICLTKAQYERLRKEAFDNKASQSEIIREALELRWAKIAKTEDLRGEKNK